MIDILKTISDTLESIEVHGSENMSKLLGCINALNQIINQPKEDGEANGG